MLTLGKAIADPMIKDAAGFCDRERLVYEINNAQQILAMLAPREHQMDKILVRAWNRCFALPRDVENAVGWSLEGCQNTILNYRHITHEWHPGGVGAQWRPCSNSIFPLGLKATFRKPSFSPFRIFAVQEDRERNEPLFLGIQGNNDFDQIFTGTAEHFYPGEKIEIASGTPFLGTECQDCDDTKLKAITYSSKAFTNITALLRRDEFGNPAYTETYTYIYALCPKTLRIEMIAYIHPYETESEFKMFRIDALPERGEAMLYLQVIKKFVPARHNDDVLFIQNIKAIESMIRSERHRLANEIQLSTIESQRAATLLETAEKRERRGRIRSLRITGNRGFQSRVR